MAASKDKASIYVDLTVLFEFLYDAQWEVPKCHRIALINRIFDHCEKAISYFGVAFDIESKRDEYVARMCEEFEALKICCRLAIKNGFYKKESTRNTIRESIAKIQEGIDKWQSYLYSNRQA